MPVVTKYASTVEALTDSRHGSEDWTGLVNAIGNTNTSAVSYCGVRNNQKFTPKELFAHDFDFDISNASKINSITVEVQMGCANNVDIENPTCNMYYGNGKPSGNYVESKAYRNPIEVYSKMSHYSNIIHYEENSTYIKLNVTPDVIERDIFGVILTFKEPISESIGKITVDWVRITIDYTGPEYGIILHGGLYASEIKAISFDKGMVGEDVTFEFHCFNQTNYWNENLAPLKLSLPFGLHFISAEAHASNDGVTSFNSNTMEWNVAKKAGAVSYLTVKCKRRTVGVKEVNLSADWYNISGYINTLKNGIYDHSGTGSDDQIVISSTDIRKGAESTFYFSVRTLNPDQTADFDIFTNYPDQGDKFVKWDLDKTLSTRGVSINDTSSNYISFNTPSGTDIVDIHFSLTFVPHNVGDATLKIEAEDSTNDYFYDYTVLDPFVYVIDLVSHDGVWKGGRLISEIETGSYILPCHTAEYDRNIVMKKPTLRAWKYEDIDYIGCVALEHTHFEPKSKFKDKLLDNSYKNKKYMGKQGIIDEDITLNVRLHPHQVSTIQGLIGIDKPVPIDANHLCFEGDALNHRGWVELTGIETEETNPHWYKCEIDVAYITHNINCRFKIEKGSKVSDYFLPNLLEDTHKSGDDISEYCDISTSGFYEYDEDATLNLVNPQYYVHDSDTIFDSSMTYFDSLLDYTRRNMVQLDNGQSVRFRTREPLNIKSIVAFNWDSTRLDTNAYNNLARIIRLVDGGTGNTVFEYEYYDIDYSYTNAYPSRVIARTFYKGAYKTILNREINLHCNVEYDASNSDDVDTYGSEILFELNGNILTLTDRGLTGKEVYLDDIKLSNGEYYFEVEFTNNNHVVNAGVVQNFFDLSIKELIFTSDYSQYYNNILVSPFPIPDRKVIFNRECEDGTLWYVEDTGEETTYLLSPYYQYHCGVDLQSREGISIFNLNNSYQTVYMTNGLVKLGINRINGKLTLFKFDKTTDSWIHISNLQLTKYDDININNFTDDKLELQASDSIFTMWRGRPYIQVKHQTEDILFSDSYTSVYGEGVAGSTDTYPHMWSLVDKTNLLEECVASERKIKSRCLEVTESTSTDADLGAYLGCEPEVGLATPAEYEVYTSTRCDYYLFINNTLVGALHDGTYLFEHQYTEPGTYQVQGLAIDGHGNYEFTNIVSVTVVDDYYRLRLDFPQSMYFMEEDFKAYLTLGGEPVSGETIVFNANGYAYPRMTDSNGRARLNNRLPAGEYTINATYTDAEDGLIAYADRKTRIKKGNVNFSLDHTTITRNNPIELTVTNNLDPESDEVEEGEQYVAKEPVVLHINGVAYPRITSSTGKASLMIRLPAGTYDLKVVYAGNGSYNSKLANYEVIVNDS